MDREIRHFLDRLEDGERFHPLENVIGWLNSRGLSREERAAVDEVIERAYSDLDTFISENREDTFSPLFQELEIHGWLKEWILHTRGELAPTSFQFAAGMVAIAGSLKRHVWAKTGQVVVYPPLQTIIIGQSGNGKSTCGDYLFREIAPNVRDVTGKLLPLFYLMIDTGSIEAMIDDLAQSQKSQRGIAGSGCGVLQTSEMNSLINQQKYNEGMIPKLNELFDTMPFYRRRTVSGGEQRIDEPGVSALFSTNDTFIGSSLGPEVFGGGFLARLMVFYDSTCRDSDKLDNYPRDEQQAEFLGRMLFRASQFSGAIEVNETAMKLWKDIRREYRGKLQIPDIRYQPLYKRLPAHVMRVAMILAVSEALSDAYATPVILDRHLSQSKSLWEWSMRSLTQVYNMIGTSFFGQIQIDIQTFLRSRGGKASNVEIGRKFSNLSHDTLDTHLATLKKNKFIKSVSLPEYEGGQGWKLTGK